MRKVCMFVWNDVRHDARVRREAATLAKAGYDVLVLATQSFGAPMHETVDGFRVLRLPKSGLARAVAHSSGVLRTKTTQPAEAQEQSYVPSRAVGLRRVATLGRAAAAALALPALRLLIRWIPLDVHYSRPMVATAVGEKADAYTAHDLTTLRMAYQAAKACGAKLIYDSHEYYLGRSPAYWDNTPLRNLRYGRREAGLIRRADAVVTVSPGVAQLLAERYRIPLPHVVRNMPLAARPGSERGLANLMRRAGLEPKGKKIVAIAGGIAPRRGLESSIRALCHLPAEVVLALLGPGRQQVIDHYRSVAGSSGVACRVAFVGAVPPSEVVPILQGAAVGLVPIEDVCASYHWSLPNKLFEAIQAGLPIVAADLPDIRAIVEEWGVGVTVSIESPEDVARGIRHVLGKAEHARLSASVRQAARALSWETEQVKLLAVYRSLLGDAERA